MRAGDRLCDEVREGGSLITVKARGRRSGIGRLARREERSAYLFLLPWLGGLLAFWIVPILWSIALSGSDWDIISSPHWVGLANFKEMLFDDRHFWLAIRETLKYMLLSVPLYMVVGLLLSLLLNLKMGPWERFRYVTFPMLTPTLLFVLLTSLIDAFQVFDTAFIVSGAQGAVGDSLRFYLLNVWYEGFQNGRLGYASAESWVLVLAAAFVILLIFKTSGRWVYYEYDPERER